jgi:hypothetical protein
MRRGTVDGLTLNRSAMTRMPGHPRVARASRKRKPGADAFLDHGALELGKYAHHLKHRTA